MPRSPTDSTDYPSTQSSFSPTSLFQRDSMSSMSTAPTSYSNHGQMSPLEETENATGSQEGGSKRGLSERARGLIGGRFGSVRGPPPAGPPPLPPLPSSNQAGPSRPSVFTRASSRFSSNPQRQSSLPAPSYPPPISPLPQPSFSKSPTSPSTERSFAGLAPIDPYGRHQRQDSATSQGSTASASSTPVSPPISPRISRRISSLAMQDDEKLTLGPYKGGRSDLKEGSSSTVTERRVPSRQLLQTALDLAQRAVEMDQGNDVIGALAAYREAVTRLKAVMERVGLEGKEGKRGSNGKAEEEGRTLKGIHDAYVARVLLLQSYESGQNAPSETGPSIATAIPDAQAGSATNTSTSSNTISSSFSSTNSAPSSSAPTLDPSSPSVTGSSDSRAPVPFGLPVEHKPRPSMESSDGGRNIGDFMLADQSFEPLSPDRPGLDATPQQTPQETPSRASSRTDLFGLTPHPASSRTSSRQSGPRDYGFTNLNAASSSTVILNEAPTPTAFLDNPPPRRESLGSTAALGLGHPISPPRFVEDTSLSPPKASGPTSADTPTSIDSSRRKRAQAASVGLEDEAGLTEADGLVNAGEMEEMIDPQERSSRPIDDDRASVHSRAGSIDKNLPPIPSDVSIPLRSSSHSRQSSLSRLGQLISETTSKGTISQRRVSRNNPNAILVEAGSPPSLPSSRSMAFPSRSSGQEIHSSSSSIVGGSRLRSKSQPGHRPGETFQAESADNVPPLPVVRKKSSFPNRHSRTPSDSLALPTPGSYRSSSPSSYAAPEPSSAMSFAGSLISPIPEFQPDDVLHRPFHLLRTIQTSMDPEGPGAYLTGAIHIPSSIWTSPASTSSKIPRGPGPQAPSSSSSGPKITAQDTKVRIMDSLLLHLEIIRHTGAPLLEGPREVVYGVPGVAAPRIGGQAVAGVGQELLGALDGLEEEMDGVYRSLVKAGVAVGAWKGKKASTNTRSWGSKVVRGMDKITNNKAMDSPDRYVDLLASMCSNIQILDDHLSNFTGPCTPAYHYIAESGYRALEQRLHRSAEFVRVVLVPFVLDDFKQFFFRYLKAGLRYIED